MLKFVSTINMNQIQNKGQMSAKSFFPLQEDETYYDKNTWNQSNVCKTKQKTKWKKTLIARSNDVVYDIYITPTKTMIIFFSFGSLQFSSSWSSL